MSEIADLTEEPPRNRRRAPDRAAMLRVAAELFARQGYRSTSMDQIADALGIAKPTLYVHGRSKSAILEGIIEEMIEEGELRLDQALSIDGLGWIRALLKSWTENAVTRPAHLHAWQLDRRELPSEIQERYRRWSKRVDRRITAKVADQQAEGVFRADIDPAIVTGALVALQNWIIRWYKPEGRLSVDEVVDQYWALLWSGLDPAAADQ